MLACHRKCNIIIFNFINILAPPRARYRNDFYFESEMVVVEKKALSSLHNTFKFQPTHVSIKINQSLSNVVYDYSRLFRSHLFPSLLQNALCIFFTLLFLLLLPLGLLGNFSFLPLLAQKMLRRQTKTKYTAYSVSLSTTLDGIQSVKVRRRLCCEAFGFRC